MRPEISISTSMTTRPPRPGEVEGENYHFVTKEDFKSKIKQEHFLEWALVHDHFYGTPSEKIVEHLRDNKDVLLEIDVQGALQVRHKFPRAVLIMVAPPTLEELKKRIVSRGTEEKRLVEKRMEVAYNELSVYDKYDYLIINETVKESVQKVLSIINAEKCRVSRLHELWNDKFGGLLK